MIPLPLFVAAVHEITMLVLKGAWETTTEETGEGLINIPTESSVD